MDDDYGRQGGSRKAREDSKKKEVTLTSAPCSRQDAVKLFSKSVSQIFTLKH